MVYSDTSTKLGLIQDCEQLIFGNYTDISGNPDRLYDFTARINRAYDKLATIIMGVDGRWQFDDTNYTDLPIGTTDLFSGRQDYTLDVEFLDIVKVLMLDPAGNKTILRPFDIDDPLGRPFLQQPPAVGGIPTHYDKTGGSVLLYPTPNYDSDGGLTVHYRRKPSYFAYTDTTKAVGVPANFHRYLSLEASFDYASSPSKQLASKDDLAVKVKEMEAQIEEWYSRRSKDEPKFIRGLMRSSR
jgi:hypothetical protein